MFSSPIHAVILTGSILYRCCCDISRSGISQLTSPPLLCTLAVCGRRGNADDLPVLNSHSFALSPLYCSESLATVCCKWKLPWPVYRGPQIFMINIFFSAEKKNSKFGLWPNMWLVCLREQPNSPYVPEKSIHFALLGEKV